MSPILARLIKGIRLIAAILVAVVAWRFGLSVALVLAGLLAVALLVLRAGGLRRPARREVMCDFVLTRTEDAPPLSRESAPSRRADPT